MKNLFKVLFVAGVATALVACNKEIENQTPETPGVRTVQFSTAPITKTVFGEASGTSLPTLWTENKTVGISLNFATFKESTTPVVGSNGATATFSADIDDSGTSPYTFYAVSPYSSIISVNNTYYSAQVDIPASQTPLSNSVDENAQILVAKLSAGASFPTSSVLMDFKHLTAYGKISFSDLSLASGETIESVSLTATENWAGRYYYYFEDHDPNSAGDLVANSAGKTITLTTSSATDIWFACAPVDLGGKNVKVVITTDKATTFTKNITIPAGKTFDSGKVNAFTINMNGIKADAAAEYVLVTSPADLTVGSQVIIAAPGATASAISTTQNTNNRAEASVTKEQENTVIVSPSDAVQIFTIEEGTTSGTIAFNTGSGYIYAASSSGNQMKTEENLSANSSWEVSIEGGVATITAQGSNTRNVIRYNSSNNPPIYSCYSSTSTTGSLVSLYKLSAPDNRSESGLGWDDTDGLGDVKDQELVLPALVNPNSLIVTYSSSDETVATVAENSHTVTLLKEGETQIHAIFAGDEIYKPADVYYTLTVSDSRTDVTLSFGTASYELTVGSSDYNNFAGQAVTASPSVAVTYALSGASVGTLNTSTGAVTLDGSTLGTATITASFAGNATYKAAEDATYTIVVSAASPSGTPGDETFDLSTNTYTTGSDSVTWTGESVTINNSGTNATNYLGGDANNRTSSRFYNGNSLVITPNTDYTITSIVFSATSANYAGVLNNSSWTNGSSSVNGSTVTVTPTNGANAVSATVGGTCGFTSIVVNYVFSGVVVTKYAITVDNGIANGSVSADLSEAAEGATVTLTATPASGYALDAWNVYKTGESGTKVTVSANAFTMPAYAVTVSASFAAVPTISMNTTSIADVAAAGVVSATASSAYSLLNGASNNDVVITCDGTVVTAASKAASAGSITYTVAANSGAARDGWIKVHYGSEDPHQITVSQLSGSATPQEYEITSGTFSGSTTSISLTVSGVTISQLKDDGTNVNTSYNTVSTLRVYRANQMQFTGKTFTKIEMYYTSTYSGADWTVVSGGGTVTIDTTNKKVVWENANGASTVALKNSTTSGTNTQLRTTKFVVTY